MQKTNPPSSQGRAVPEAVRLSPKLVLGRYHVMESRGTGGFGTVLTCWDTRLQRRVAIKRMPLQAAGATTAAASTVQEALAEARTACLLAHPNIVGVFDFEADATCAYLVMEYVDGLNLAELLARVEGGTLTGDECAYLVRCVADALSFAHDNGVLHLDIKPSNIIIDQSGTVKLCDFGMATLASATGYGDARGGTVGYMSPEQIRGQLVDERSDVFSLGVVVWQALTGKNPFAATTAEQSLKLIERGPRTKLSKVVPDVEGISEQALLGALGPLASMRTPSVRDFEGELTYTLGDEEAGAESLRHLLSQASQDGDSGEWEGEGLPMAFRYPWVGPLILRATSAVTSGLSGLVPLAYVFYTQSATLLGAAIFAALGAAWPPIGSALVVVTTLFALLTTTTGAQAVLLPLVLAALLVAWWALLGTRDHHATAAVLLPCCLHNPLGGVAWAGAFLPPGEACAATAAGWLLCRVLVLSDATGFVAVDVVGALRGLALAPSTWASLAGCLVAAALTSAVAHLRPTSACAVAGQVVGTAALITSQLLAARMENGGIWAAPTWETTGLAVVLGVLLCIAAVLSGPQYENQGDDYDELL